MGFDPSHPVKGFRQPMDEFVQTVFADIFPALFIFEEKIGLRYFCEKDVEIVIIDLRSGGREFFGFVPPPLRQNNGFLFPTYPPAPFCIRSHAEGPLLQGGY